MQPYISAYVFYSHFLGCVNYEDKGKKKNDGDLYIFPYNSYRTKT